MSKSKFSGAAALAAVTAMTAALIVLASDLKSDFATLKSDVASLKKVSAGNSPLRVQSDARAPFIRGWAVRIYEAPRLRSDTKSISSQDYAGAFIHTGSWISLDDYKKHEGIFLSGEAALSLRGQFRPSRKGRYVFAVHMKIVPDVGENVRDVPTISCYARLVDQSGNQLLNGKMLVDGQHTKGALISKTSISAGQNDARLLDLSFTCDGRPKIEGEKILFRLCFRKAEDAKFQPLVPILRV